MTTATKTDTREVRSFAIPQEMSVRAADAEGKRTLAGYAAVFGNLYDVWSWGGQKVQERVAPGAFGADLAEKPDVRSLVEHSGGLSTLGRTSSGTLRLREDGKGLFTETDIPDTQAGRDAYELVKRGDLSQMSFAFSVVKESWEYPSEDVAIRTLEAVKLYDVSVVAFPANPATSVEARSAPPVGIDPAWLAGTGEFQRRQRALQLAEWDG